MYKNRILYIIINFPSVRQCACRVYQKRASFSNIARFRFESMVRYSGVVNQTQYTGLYYTTARSVQQRANDILCMRERERHTHIQSVYFLIYIYTTIPSCILYDYPRLLDEKIIIQTLTDADTQAYAGTLLHVTRYPPVRLMHKH